MESLLFLETDYLVTGIVALVTTLVSAFCIFVCVSGRMFEKLNRSTLFTFMSFITGLLTVVTTILDCNLIMSVAFFTSIVAFALSLTHLSIEFHKDLTYSESKVKQFIKIFIPLLIIFFAFRPWFVDGNGAVLDSLKQAKYEEYGVNNDLMLISKNANILDTLQDSAVSKYSWLAVLGVNASGTYAYTFDSFYIVTVLELLQFALLVLTQVYVIIRQFRNPDYNESFSLFHLFITAVTSLFIWGLYTSSKLRILETMPNYKTTSKVVYLIVILSLVLYFIYNDRIILNVIESAKEKKQLRAEEKALKKKSKKA